MCLAVCKDCGSIAEKPLGLSFKNIPGKHVWCQEPLPAVEWGVQKLPVPKPYPYCTFSNILELLSLSLGSRGFSTHERKIKIKNVIHTKWTQDLTWRSDRTAVSPCHSHQVCRFALPPMFSVTDHWSLTFLALKVGVERGGGLSGVYSRGSFLQSELCTCWLTCQLTCKQRDKKTQKRQQDTPSGFLDLFPKPPPVLFYWAKPLL